MELRGRSRVPPAVVTAWLTGISAVTGAEPAASEVAGWVAHLAADQFAQREAAARNLVGAGRIAAPAVAQAAADRDLEVASRAVEIAREWLLTPDAELADEAERLLVACVEQGRHETAILARSVLDFHAAGMDAAARERLRSLGAVVHDATPVEHAGVEVDFDAAWHGSPADFARLQRLRGLVAVRVRGVPLDAEALAILARLPTLQRLELFGAGCDDDAARALAASLPDARIDIRKGGRLGVRAVAAGGPCEIGTVEPGSAADQAGLRSGDVVVRVDGEPVGDFDALTGRLARLDAGATVVLEVSRAGGRADGEPEVVQVSVRLDAW